MKLAVMGHLVMDTIISVDRLPAADTSIEVRTVHTSYGGPAGNLASVAAMLGVDTSILSFVGKNFPEEYRKRLEDREIDLRGVTELDGERTPTAWIVSEIGGKQAALFYQGAMKNIGKREIPVGMRKILHDIDILHIGTGDPEFHKRLADMAEDTGRAKIGFEPGQEIHYIYDENTLWAMLKRSDIYFTNENEWKRTAELLHLKREEEMLELVELYVKTMGDRGSVIYTEEGIFRIPAIRPDRVRDTTGSGDAYKGGFYAAMGRGFSPEKCGLAGAAAASYIIEQEETQMERLTWEMLEKRMERK